jgi:hypothetical protein
MAWQYKEWGGIRKAETEVVRIKGRRRDKGGGGWEKQISRVGGSALYINSLSLSVFEGRAGREDQARVGTRHAQAQTGHGLGTDWAWD